MKSNKVFIVGLITATILIFVYLSISFNTQKEINNKLQANISALQDQQGILLNLLENVEFSTIEITNNLTTNIIDYYSCFEKKSLGINNPDVLDAVQALCMPHNIESVIEYSSENSIFLNCLIDKGARLSRNESIVRITQQCVEYEKKVSKQIKIRIEKLNNE
jgi:hypothetical protein